MSFLTKSKPSFQESPPRFGSKYENKDRSNTENFSARQKDDLMSGLQQFREGLRKEISGKLTTSLKSIDIKSPTGPSNFKTLHSNQNLNTPNYKGESYNKEKEGLWTTKTSQSKIDINKELARRGDRDSPLKQLHASKNADLLGYFGQNKSSQKLSQNLGESSLLGSKSPFKKNESPKKDIWFAGDIKPLDYYRRENEQRSYLDSKTSPRSALSKQKEDISQILTNRSPASKEAYSSLSKGFRERPKTGLLEQTYNTHLTPSRVDLLLTSSKLGSDSSSLLKTSSADILKNSRYLGSAGVQSGTLSYSNANYGEEQGRPKKVLGMELKSLSIMNQNNGRESFSNLRAELGERERRSNKNEILISDQLPLQRVHEVQDLFYNVNDKTFDQLPADYIEELIKLSSVIMQRVKGSSYYNRS